MPSPHRPSTWATLALRSARSSGLVTTEGGGTATFTVVLNTQPTASVTIGLSSSDTTEGTVSPASLTFTTANWNSAQTVTVTGVDDAIPDGDQLYSIVTAAASSSDPGYNGLDPADVLVANTDNDAPGITVNPASGLVTTEGGGTATFTVVLNTQPTANVTIALSSSDTTEGTVSPGEPDLHDRELEQRADGDGHRGRRRGGGRQPAVHDRRPLRPAAATPATTGWTRPMYR